MYEFFFFFNEQNDYYRWYFINIVPDRKFYLRNFLFIFLPINLNMCFGCSKEPSY